MCYPIGHLAPAGNIVDMQNEYCPEQVRRCATRSEYAIVLLDHRPAEFCFKHLQQQLCVDDTGQTDIVMQLFHDNTPSASETSTHAPTGASFVSFSAQQC